MNAEIYTDPKSRFRTIAGEAKPIDMFSETIGAMHDISVYLIEIDKLAR